MAEYFHSVSRPHNPKVAPKSEEKKNQCMRWVSNSNWNEWAAAYHGDLAKIRRLDTEMKFVQMELADTVVQDGGLFAHAYCKSGSDRAFAEEIWSKQIPGANQSLKPDTNWARTNISRGEDQHQLKQKNCITCQWSALRNRKWTFPESTDSLRSGGRRGHILSSLIKVKGGSNQSLKM